MNTTKFPATVGEAIWNGVYNSFPKTVKSYDELNQPSIITIVFSFVVFTVILAAPFTCCYCFFSCCLRDRCCGKRAVKKDFITTEPLDKKSKTAALKKKLETYGSIWVVTEHAYVDFSFARSNEISVPSVRVIVASRNKRDRLKDDLRKAIVATIAELNQHNMIDGQLDDQYHFEFFVRLNQDLFVLPLVALETFFSAGRFAYIRKRILDAESPNRLARRSAEWIVDRHFEKDE